jgi:hypothetical protein
MEETQMTATEKPFNRILDDAAEMGRDHVRSYARLGIVCGSRLYYKHEALALQSEACNHDMTQEGWIATDRVMPASVPYDRFWTWIRDHSGDLPIYA